MAALPAAEVEDACSGLKLERGDDEVALWKGALVEPLATAQMEAHVVFAEELLVPCHRWLLSGPRADPEMQKATGLVWPVASSAPLSKC